MTIKARVKSKHIKFVVPIIVEWDEINYHAYSPVLKGLHMDGETVQEALENAKLTAKDFLEIMIEEGSPIPLSTLIKGNSKQPAVLSDKKDYYEVEILIDLP